MQKIETEKEAEREGEEWDGQNDFPWFPMTPLILTMAIVKMIEIEKIQLIILHNVDSGNGNWVNIGIWLLCVSGSAAADWVPGFALAGSSFWHFRDQAIRKKASH